MHVLIEDHESRLSGEFHGKKRECGGCEFKDRVKEVFCEIYWNDKINKVVLKKVGKPNI